MSYKFLTNDQLKFWEEKGYLVLNNFMFEAEIDEANHLIDELWQKENRLKKDNPLVIDIFIGTDKERRVYLKDAPEEARLEPYKLNDLFLEYKLIKELILKKTLCKILTQLLDGFPMACNSLSFERGSQQDYHFDTFYMPPPVENKMLATWIALENCSMEAGPLKYYPGSHKIKPFLFSNNKLNAIPDEMPKFYQYIEKELTTRNLKPETFIPKKGDVLIWHAQLYHGGGAITNKRITRKSLVTHYFRTQEFGRLSYVSLGKYQHYLKRSHQLPLKPKEETKISFVKKLIKKVLQ